MWETTRPLSSAVAGTLTTAVAGNLAAGLAMTALAMFGFAVNDIFDYRKDRAARVRRPIADGRLSKAGAACLAAGMLACAAVLGLAAGSGGAVLAITAAALTLYSPLALRYPLIKDAMVAGLCCLPLYYGAVAGGRQVAWVSYAGITCFVMGREILMDADELEGDRKAGIRTVAAVWGRVRTARIGSAVMLVSAAALIVLVDGAVAKGAAAGTLALLACVFTWPGLGWHRRVELSRWPMLLGAIALARGGA